MTTATETPGIVELPRDGYRLYFKEDGHAYQRVNDKGLPGLRYPSVSTIAGCWPDKPDGLMDWAARLTVKGVCDVLLEDGPLIDDNEMKARLNPGVLAMQMRNRGMRWQDQRDQAAERGTNVHVEMLQALAKGEQIPDLAALPLEQRGYGQAVMKWWLANRPEPLNVEQIVLSLDHGYAGRFDLRAEIGPVTVLIDLKTSAYISPKMHVQTQGYEIAARECGVGASNRHMILQVLADGTYREWPVQATELDFHTARTIHKLNNALSGRCRSITEQVKAATA